VQARCCDICLRHGLRTPLSPFPLSTIDLSSVLMGSIGQALPISLDQRFASENGEIREGVLSPGQKYIMGKACGSIFLRRVFVSRRRPLRGKKPSELDPPLSNGESGQAC